MSLKIDPAEIIAALLADGWHDVEPNSFDIDSYEFVVPAPDDPGPLEDDEDFVMHGGGQSGVCASGFFFVERKTASRFAGPLTSLLAIRLKGLGKKR